MELHVRVWNNDREVKCHVFYPRLENSRLLIRRILQSDWSIRGLYIG